jgi:hypothetical protein
MGVVVPRPSPIILWVNSLAADVGADDIHFELRSYTLSDP